MLNFCTSSAYKTIIVSAAEKHNISVELLTDLIYFYYDELYEKVSNLKESHLSMDGLGKLVLSERKLEEAIQKIGERLDNSESKEGRHLNRYFNEERILILKRGLERIRNSKNKLNEKHIKRLEEQKANSRRNSE